LRHVGVSANLHGHRAALAGIPFESITLRILPLDWSREEVAATVADYFDMLRMELLGLPYNKREHNRDLQKLLRNRSAGAVEYKHANISAVLIELGFPYIDGYKPRGNYQELLRDEIIARLEGDLNIAEAAERAVDAPATIRPHVSSLEDVFEDPPVSDHRPIGVYERRPIPPVAPRKINYLEREARNQSLGAAGELFVLEVEHRRLWESGHRHLAERIEHVAQTQGDGLGYDIVSYDTGGRDRLIEVKTTNFGRMTPFFASEKEVHVSETRSSHYQVYRVFRYRTTPRIFALPGSLRSWCDLTPIQYRASLH
jgi:hypothetical protein